jgi:hypothetical protein
MDGDEINGKDIKKILSTEQEAVLDLYVSNLDNYFENLKKSEKVQVEIETLHLKRILTK